MNYICLARRSVLTIVIALVCNSASFNIAQTESAAQYLPVNARNQNAEAAKNGSHGISFYGNQMKILEDGRILISSPKWMVTKPSLTNQPSRGACGDYSSTDQGSVSNCKINFNETSECQRVCRPVMKQTNNFGFIMENSGNMTWACSPSEVLRCDEDNYRTPGVCFSSQDTGRTWTRLERPEQECPHTTLQCDVIFVLDGSGSVSGHFNDILEWTEKMTEKLNLQAGVTQVGVVQFSAYDEYRSLDNQNYITTEIGLGQYKSHEAFRDALREIVFQSGGSTFIARAIDKAVMDFKRASRWRNKDVKKVMVVLTDGRTSDYLRLPSSAERVRSLGIIPFAVGVGRYKKSELQVYEDKRT